MTPRPYRSVRDRRVRDRMNVTDPGTATVAYALIPTPNAGKQVLVYFTSNVIAGLTLPRVKLNGVAATLFVQKNPRRIDFTFAAQPDDNDVLNAEYLPELTFGPNVQYEPAIVTAQNELTIVDITGDTDTTATATFSGNMTVKDPALTRLEIQNAAKTAYLTATNVTPSGPNSSFTFTFPANICIDGTGLYRMEGQPPGFIQYYRFLDESQTGTVGAP